jgi:Bacterial Ig domain
LPVYSTGLQLATGIYVPDASTAKALAAEVGAWKFGGPYFASSNIKRLYASPPSNWDSFRMRALDGSYINDYYGTTFAPLYSLSSPVFQSFLKTQAKTAADDTTPPVVTITQPASGSVVSRNVSIAVSATDNVGVSHVSIYVDNVQLCNDASAPYTCSWNTHKISAGSHTITATAWDAVGNAGHATPVPVTK